MPAGVRTLPFLNVFVGLVVMLVVLYWAKAVVIPVAMAILLTFLLTPIVNVLWRHGLGRAPAAVVVVVLVFGLVGAIGWTIAAQISTFTSELPAYTDNLKQKIAQVQHAGTGGTLGKVQKAVEEVISAFQQGLPSAPGSATPGAGWTEGPSVLSYLPSLLESVLTALMVLVLVLFMLIEHGALRDRLLAFGGYGRLTLTTKALDEASQRISRYLLMQSLVNGSFGLVFGLGLFVLGVPYALLWGFLAAALRFIPYVGTLIAAVLPITFSLAVFPGWTQPLLASGLFVLLELAIISVLEPVLYGRSTGISQVALLVAVLCWTWLWGPVGLLLSTPLTVCLSVLGKYVPPLAFLGVVLSDEPVAGMNTYYQRLVARDQDEAAAIVDECLKTQTLVEVYDTVLVPALSYAKQDLQRDTLTADEAQGIIQATQEIVEDLGTRPSPPTPEGSTVLEDGTPTAPLAKVRIVGCPARDESDALALQMFQQVCDPMRYEVELLPVALRTADVVARVAQTPSALLCIGAVAPGGLARTRYLCKRLRARFPELTIVVGHWGETALTAENLALLRADGIEQVGTTLRETRDQVMHVSQRLASLTPHVVPRVA
jgi:predicted PurR-regulated permease PerM